jgi:hypothetical protein
MLVGLGLAFTISVGMAYAIINLLPFDSYSIAWDRQQILYFALYYLSMTLPFIISGLGIGAALIQGQSKNHIFYASNLLGSALGALLAPITIWLAGIPGAMLFSGILGLGVILISSSRLLKSERKIAWSFWITIGFTIGGIILLLNFAMLNFQSRAPLGMTISPYKGLAQALRFPNSNTIFSRWNAISRLDIVANAGTHQLPGLSYLYPGIPPEQVGLSVDAGSLQAITPIEPQDFEATNYLPESIVFATTEADKVLVLEPGGGLGILQALSGGSEQVTAVVDNELIPQAIAATSKETNVYTHSKVQTKVESIRVFLRSEDDNYSIIFLPLTDTYRPVSSGAYSLAEDYSLTVEGFTEILERLRPTGVFVFSRWLQIPPSESLRAIATLVEALERHQSLPAADTLVIYRGIQTITVLMRPTGWPSEILDKIREFTQERKFDLVWTPDIKESEVNRFNRLEEPSFYFAVRDLLTSTNRDDFYSNYPYKITPPTDDQPFFFHFFRWGQIPEVLATLGHTWQPFGGSGYLILFALFILTVIFSLGLILLPLMLQPKDRNRGQVRKWLIFFYFALLGIAFLFIEIPLIQQLILFFNHPTYAFTFVVVILLCFSGFGSMLARASWLPQKVVFTFLVLLSFSVPWGISNFSSFLLGIPVWGRGLVTAISLAPLGFLMGVPFPLGLTWLEGSRQTWVPWAWAVNGCTSVVASVLAAILSLSYGFSMVLFLGAGAYAGAAILSTQMMKDQ